MNAYSSHMTCTFSSESSLKKQYLSNSPIAPRPRRQRTQAVCMDRMVHKWCMSDTISQSDLPASWVPVFDDELPSFLKSAAYHPLAESTFSLSYPSPEY